MRNAWSVPSESEFPAFLGKLDVRLPKHRRERTKEQRERRCLARLLPSIRGELRYPFRLAHAERPDFTIELPDLTIGIEHSEVVPQNVASAQVFRDDGLGPAVYMMPRAIFGEPRKCASELRREILNDERMLPWYGDEPEQETSAALTGFALEKLNGANKDGYRRFAANWLLLDNRWPGPGVDVLSACEKSHADMVANGVFDFFERVYVLDSEAIVGIRATNVAISRTLAA